MKAGPQRPPYANKSSPPPAPPCSLTDVNSVDRYHSSLATQPGSGNPSPCLPKGWSCRAQTSPAGPGPVAMNAHIIPLSPCKPRSACCYAEHRAPPSPCDLHSIGKRFTQPSLLPWQLCSAPFMQSELPTLLHTHTHTHRHTTLSVLPPLSHFTRELHLSVFTDHTDAVSMSVWWDVASVRCRQTSSALIKVCPYIYHMYMKPIKKETMAQFH